MNCCRSENVYRKKYRKTKPYNKDRGNQNLG